MTRTTKRSLAPVPDWALAIVRDAPRLMTRVEAAKLCRTGRSTSETPSARTIDRAIRRGALAAVRIGARVLIPAEALAAYLASCACTKGA